MTFIYYIFQKWKSRCELLKIIFFIIKKFVQEVKMSKEAPTKKQLYYYDRLCKKYSIEKKDVEELSKLDLRNEIESILNEHSDDYKNVD